MFARAGLALIFDIIVIGDGFGANEAALEVAVDFAGRLGRLGTLVDGPGARFLGAAGEKGLQVEQFISGADDAREAGLFQPHFGQEFHFLLAVHADEVALDRGGDDHRLGALGLGLFEHARGKCIALGGGVFLDIADIQDRLGGEQLRLREQAFLFLIVQLGQPRGLAVAQQIERLGQHGGLRLGVLVARIALFLEGGDALFQALQIGQHQLGLHRLGIGDGIDLVFDMLDVVILEAAQHMDDGVHLADIAEELVAQAFTRGGTAHEAGNVHERQLRLDDLGAARDLGDGIQPRIGHRDLADIRLDRAERIVRRLRRLRFRQRVEQGGLADIGQPDDTAFETHEIFPNSKVSRPHMGGPH